MRLPMMVIARALALIWAAFWTFFFVAESWAWRAPARILTFWSGAGLVFMILALVPWGWEMTGGVLLAVAGPSIGLAYAIWSPAGLPLSNRMITNAFLSGPPLLAGLLLLIRHRAVAARA